MSKRTIQEISQIVDSEGLGYSIQYYLDYSQIEDPLLSDKWKQAKELLREIEDILSPYSE